MSVVVWMGSDVVVWSGSVVGVRDGEGALVDAFTSLSFFFFINAIFSLVVISKVPFFIGDGVDMGTTDIGSMVMDGSACWFGFELGVILVMVWSGWGICAIMCSGMCSGMSSNEVVSRVDWEPICFGGCGLKIVTATIRKISKDSR